MTAFDNTFVPMALQMINGVGKAVVWGRPNGNGYNPATGEAGGAASEATIKAWEKAPDPKAFPNATVATADRMLLVAAAAVDAPIDMGHEFTFDGHTYTVPERGVAPVYSGEQVCLYKVLASFG